MENQFSQSSQTMESETQCPTQMETENQRKTRKTNYSQHEDEALVKAWLHVSGDAVVGRDQKSTKLWMRVLESFHQIMGRITERNAQGLQNRWQAISHDVSKFCGYYNKVGRLNPSGWNDQMILDEAKQQYGEIEGPLQAKPVPFWKFKFEHCWKLLKDSPKWNDHVLTRNTSNSKGCKKPSNPQSQPIGLNDLGTPSTPLTPCSIPLDEVNSLDPEHNQVRPEGRRKTKAKRKNEWKEEESTLYLKSINETLAQTAMIEKEKWEAKKDAEKEKLKEKKRRTEQKAMREEMKVMRQSMEGLTLEQATYWKFQQSLIIERYKANGFLPDLESYENNHDFGF